MVVKFLLVLAGLIAVALGAIGVVLPLLPTTPFLLLAAACFIRSSDRLYQWLITNRWCGEYIRQYREHRAITLRTKVVSLTLLWLTIGYSAIGVVSHWHFRIMLLAIATGVTVHLCRLKTLRRKKQNGDTHEQENDMGTADDCGHGADPGLQ